MRKPWKVKTRSCIGVGSRLIKRDMVNFRLFGIPVTIQPFFWITLGILGIMSYQPDSIQGIMFVCLFVLAGLISILVHELGHALMARKFGARTEIVLQAFGGYAAYTGAGMSRMRTFLITAAGPLIQILLGFAVLALVKAAPQQNLNAHVFLSTLIQISFIWAILNLLPVLPLDGGQMLNAILGPARIRTTLTVTIVVAVFAAGALLLWTGSILFPIFMGMFAWQAYQSLQEMGPR